MNLLSNPSFREVGTRLFAAVGCASLCTALGACSSGASAETGKEQDFTSQNFVIFPAHTIAKGNFEDTTKVFDGAPSQITFAFAKSRPTASDGADQATFDQREHLDLDKLGATTLPITYDSAGSNDEVSLPMDKAAGNAFLVYKLRYGGIADGSFDTTRYIDIGQGVPKGTSSIESST
jgi:hypothetical protein